MHIPTRHEKLTEIARVLDGMTSENPKIERVSINQALPPAIRWPVFGGVWCAIACTPGIPDEPYIEIITVLGPKLPQHGTCLVDRYYHRLHSPSFDHEIRHRSKWLWMGCWEKSQTDTIEWFQHGDVPDPFAMLILKPL